MTITPYRRHSAKCPHKSQRAYKKCNCPMWLEYWHNGKCYRKSAQTRSWELGEKLARSEQGKYQQVLLGEQPKPVAMLMDDAVASFLDSKRGEAVDKDTLQKHRRTLRLLLDYCYRKNLSFIRELTLPHLTAHRAEWEENLPSKLSRRNNQGRIKEFFRYCRRSKWIEENPAEDLNAIKIKKNEQIKTDPFSPQEMQSILTALAAIPTTEYNRQRLRALILAQRHSGLSIEDAVALPREGIIEEKDNYRVVTDRKKTGAHIDNVIPTWIGRELLAAPNANSKYLLWGGEGSGPESSVKRFQRLLRDVFEAAEITEGHSHRFRDTAAVELLLKGVGIEEVAQFLGDTVPVAARYYAKWNQRRQKRLDEMLRATFEPTDKSEQSYLSQ